LMMEVLHSSKTSVITRTTWHNILKDRILHSHHRENLKSSISVLSKVHNRVCVSFPSPEDGNRSNFQNAVLSSYLELWTMDKDLTPSDSECYTPLSDLLDSTYS
jgi:hypothetical protein